MVCLSAGLPFRELEERGDRDRMKFKDKCEVPHVGRNGPLQWYRPGSSAAEKGLGVLAGSELSRGL